MHRFVIGGAIWSRHRTSRAVGGNEGLKALARSVCLQAGKLHYRNVNYWQGRLCWDQQKCLCFLQERKLALGKSAYGAMKKGNPSTLQKQYRLTWMIKATANSSQMEMLPWNLQISMILGEKAFLWVERRLDRQKDSWVWHQKLLLICKISSCFWFWCLFCIASSSLF